MWHVWETGEVHTEYWWGNLRDREHLEDLSVDGDNIEMDLQGVGCEAWTDWFDLAQDRNRWRAVVNAVMNLRVL
jgi:hypothetical protein